VRLPGEGEGGREGGRERKGGEEKGRGGDERGSWTAPDIQMD